MLRKIFGRLLGSQESGKEKLVTPASSSSDVEAPTSIESETKMPEDSTSRQVRPDMSETKTPDVTESKTPEKPQETSAKKTSPEDSITAWQIVANLGAIIFAKENRRNIYSAALLTGIASALNMAAPYLIGEQFDAIASDSSSDPSLLGIDVSVQTMTLVLMGVACLSQIIPNLRDQLLVPVSSRSTRDILTTITDHQLNKSLDYHTRAQFGEQMYLMQKGFASASIATPMLTQIVPTLFEITAAMGILSYQYGIGMGAGIAGITGLYAAYSAMTTKPIIESREAFLKAGNAAMQKMASAIKQYKNIYDFGKYRHEMKAVKEAVDKAAETEIKASTTPLKIGLGHIAIPRLGMLAACIYVGNRMASMDAGEFTPQDFIFMYTYFDKLCTMLPAVGTALNGMFSTFPDLRFVFRELVKESEISDPHPDTKLKTDLASASIRFENVTFAYPGKPPIFKNLSFSIEAGESVAFVSKSGGGKSTIFKLLYGYIAPTEGKIFINGQDISTVSLKSLQESIGSIAQTPNLFNGSVGDNIRYAAPDSDDVDDAQIWELADKLNLAEFLSSLDRGYKLEPLNDELPPGGPKDDELTESKIFIYRERDNPRLMYACKLPKSDEFPEGEIIRAPIVDEHDPSPIADKLEKYFVEEILNEYPFPVIDQDEKNEFLDLLLARKHIQEKRLETQVGEDGKALSGGEQQRVAILRGLLKPGPIRLFDEITSALDAMTAKDVLDGIEKLTQGKTRLTITHTLADAQHVDKIIVLHKGKVVAQGKHEELLINCDLYRQLWNKQHKQSPALVPQTAHSTARIVSQTGIPAELLLSQTATDPIYPKTAPVSKSAASTSDDEKPIESHALDSSKGKSDLPPASQAPS